MSHSTDQHLCLSDLLEEDLSSYEFFQTLPQPIQEKLEQMDVSTFAEMQQAVSKIKKASP